VRCLASVRIIIFRTEHKRSMHKMCAGFFGGHQESPEKLKKKKNYLPTVPAPIIPIRIVMLLLLLLLLFPCSVDFTGAFL